MEKLYGVVERVTYANEDKGYSVIKIKSKGYNDLIALVGNMASVNVGAVVSVSGVWAHNAKYGRQFNVTAWEESVPATVYGIEKYLGSGLIKGVGPKLAKEIVRHFEENAIEIIENEPHRLLDIPKIGKKRVAAITKAIEQTKEIKNIMIFLQECGVSTAFGYRIYKTCGSESISTVKENPYKLADDVWGIGFVTADRIAEKLGMTKESSDRLRASIFYALNQFANEGHCYAPKDELADKSAEILDVCQEEIIQVLESKPPEGFSKNADNPLEGDVLLLDECSMIDILLFYNLLKAIPNNMTIILIGDVDQLPAVGAGNVFGDIINSNAVPVIRLTRIFRQAMGSKIIQNAHKINNGKIPDLSGGKSSDFFFIEIGKDEKEQILEEIISP